MACEGRRLVKIKIYGIIGFSGFARRASLTDKRSSAFVLAGFSVMAKSASRAKRNPENPANPENPDSDKDAVLAKRVNHPKSSAALRAGRPRSVYLPIPTKARGWRNESITRNQARLRRRPARAPLTSQSPNCPPRQRARRIRAVSAWSSRAARLSRGTALSCPATSLLGGRSGFRARPRLARI